MARPRNGGKSGGTGKSGARRPPEAGPAEETSPPASSASSGGSWASTAPDGDPLEVEQPGTWTPPRDGSAVGAAEHGGALEYEPPAPELVEWTPERAGAIVRGGGFLLHTMDPVASDELARELWRATQADVDAIAPPLSRILNRYEPARRLAGVSDEAELAFGLMAYARRNLATRGRVIATRRREAEAAVSADPLGGSFGTPPPPDVPPA